MSASDEDHLEEAGVVDDRMGSGNGGSVGSGYRTPAVHQPIHGDERNELDEELLLEENIGIGPDEYMNEELQIALHRIEQLENEKTRKESEAEAKIRELEEVVRQMTDNFENNNQQSGRDFQLEADETCRTLQKRIFGQTDRIKGLELKVKMLEEQLHRSLPSGKVHDYAHNNVLFRAGNVVNMNSQNTNPFQTPEELFPPQQRQMPTRNPTMGKETYIMRNSRETARGYNESTEEIVNSSCDTLGAGSPHPHSHPQYYQNCPQSQNPPQGYNEESILQKILISNSIPEPLVFSAESKALTLRKFQHSFEMKYKQLPTLDQLVLLETRFLSGKALKVFNGIPDKEKFSVQSAFQALGERLRVSVQDESRTAKAKWERLKIKDNQSMEDYCLILDEVAEKAFSRIPPKDVSSFKTTKLLSALTDKNADVVKGMLEVQLRTVPEEDHYEECRKLAIVIENDARDKGRQNQNDKPKQQSNSFRHFQRSAYRSENSTLPLSFPVNSSQPPSFPQNTPQYKPTGVNAGVNFPQNSQPYGSRTQLQNRPSNELPTNRWNPAGYQCRECGQIGHHIPNCSRINQSIECYFCYEKGHYASSCPRKKSTLSPTSEEKDKVNAVEVTGNTLSNVEVGGTTLTKVKENTETGRGPCPLQYGMIGKSPVTFLIDSGSAISIIARNTWDRLVQENGADWEKASCKKDPTAPKAFAANNTVINLLFQVKVETTMTTRTREVVYQIADTDRNCVIIGTNAFETMDIIMNIGGNSRAIKMTQNIVLEPGEAKIVEVQVEGLVLEEKKYCLVIPKSEILSPTICQVNTHGKTWIQLSNFGKNPIDLEKGQIVAAGEMEDFEILVDKSKIEQILSTVFEPERPNVCATETPDTEITVEKCDDQVNNVRISNESRMERLWEHLEKGEKIENQDIRTVINQFREIFAIDDNELGRAHSTTCEIILAEGAQPIRQKPRPIPLSIRPQIRKMLLKMIDQKVIKESNSPWASPVVLVKKKDGSVRMCIDYRKVNKVVIANAHPLPHVETTLQSLAGKKVFTTLDLMAGYWQVPLKAESQKITAFAIGSELYEWNVLPFGLNVAPAIFQSTMEKVVGDSLGKSAYVYIDDLLIASDTIEQHVHDLRDILVKIRESGMKLRATKCYIARDTVEYLGHRIVPGGVQTEDKKVEKMRAFPRPENGKELHSFLGLVGYYQKFIWNFSKLANPLTPLTSKKAEWKWEDAQEEAFQKLKQAICEAPVLAQPDVEAAVSGKRPFLIFTDASRQGVGAVLAQENELGEQHPIAFASKSLTPAEKRYHVTDLEALAMIQALKRFKVIIYGTQVIVYTDHRPLVSLLTGTQLADRLLRWSVEILAYNVKIVFIPGKENRVADILSRGGCSVMERDESTKELSQIINAVDLSPTDMNLLDQTKWKDWLKKEDVGWEKLINKLENGDVEGQVKIKSCKKPILVENYAIIGNLLRNTELPEYSRIVVPECAQKVLVSEIHEGKLGGHFSAKKMLRQIKQKFFWPKMFVIVEKYVKACSKCLCTNDVPKLTAPLTPYKTSFPLEIVACDLVDIGLSTQGNRYLLTIIDLFSKYGAAIPIPDKKAETVVKAFVERWAIGESRIPHTLLTDQGKEYVNAHFAQLAELLQFKHVFTKGYNSRANGCIERFNKTIVHIIKKKSAVPFEWDDQVSFAVFAYNNCSHQTTGESPNFLMNGRDSGPPIIMKGEDAAGVDYVDADEYKHLLKTELLKAHKRAKEHAEMEVEKYKTLFDKKFKTEDRKFPQIGSRVLVEIPSEKLGARCPKLVNKWRGPYRVIDCTNNSATVTPVIGNQRVRLVIPYENLRVIPTEMDDSPIETVKNRRQVIPNIESLKVDEINIPDTVPRTNTNSFCRNVEIYHCRCVRPCQFHLPVNVMARTTSPTQLVRMAHLVQEYPELAEKDLAADLLILAQQPVPGLPQGIPQAAWKSLSICPTLLLVFERTPLGRELQSMVNQKLAGYAGKDRWANAPVTVFSCPLVKRENIPLEPRPIELSARNYTSEICNTLKQLPSTKKIALVVPAHRMGQIEMWQSILDVFPSKYPISILPEQVADEDCQDIDSYSENLQGLTRSQGDLWTLQPSTPIGGAHRGRKLLDVGTSVDSATYWKLVHEQHHNFGHSWSGFKTIAETETEKEADKEDVEIQRGRYGAKRFQPYAQRGSRDRSGFRGDRSGFGGRGGSSQLSKMTKGVKAGQHQYP